MEKKVFVQSGNETWGAYIYSDDCITCCNTNKAIVKKNNGRWRFVEWFIVPDQVKERFFAKREAM